MLIELLSNKELDMIDTYREEYAYSDKAKTLRTNLCPSSYLLGEWEEQKSKYLYDLFGQKLVISKKIKYEKDYDELKEEIEKISSFSYGRVARNGAEFSRAWTDYILNNRCSFTSEQFSGLSWLLSTKYLISNIYGGESFSIDLPDGKKYKINHGCKVSKVLGKLAKIFDIPGWEDFRICHSQVLNQKYLEGTLTLSIHPLDYMTMSDNTYGWDSCMSWGDEGGYRLGTTEMMNSQSVVVAYLSGENDMRIGKSHWNNKKWRQLFVVDKNVIIGVKDYPYHNDHLNILTAEWLKELASENLKWEYDELFKYNYDDGSRIYIEGLPEEKNNFYLSFNTNNMYNDFGCMPYHWTCLSNNIDEDSFTTTRFGTSYLTTPYSGKCQCMICGDVDGEFENESCLACQNCQYFSECDCCGDYCGTLYEVDDMLLCDTCYENRTVYCDSCNALHYQSNVKQIFVIPRISPEESKQLAEEYIEENTWWHCNFCHTTDELRQADFIYLNEDDPIFTVCEEDEECYRKLIEKVMLPGERPHLRELRWYDHICIYFDQLNEYGKSFMNGEDNEDYKCKNFTVKHLTPSRLTKLL